MRLTKDGIDNILTEAQKALEEGKQSEEQIREFLQAARTTLEDYGEHFPENTEVEYSIHKFMGKIELILTIPGERMSPFEEGSGAGERWMHSKINLLAYDPFSNIHYHYVNRNNIVAITTQRGAIDLHDFKKPMVMAAILGLGLGLLCQLLPASLNTFLVDDLASPILRIMMGAMSGMMGPIIFLSLVASISAQDSISELNSSGKKLFQRFFLTAVFVALVSIVIGALIFPVIGVSRGSFELDQIVSLLLSVVPTSFITPFVDNNIAQIVVLGVLMGAGLLLIKEKVSALLPLLEESKRWLSEVLSLVMKIMPAVPFLSIFKIAAKGRFDMIIHGWRYIAGSYLCMLVCLSIKLAVVSFKCQINPLVFAKKFYPLFTGAVMSGSETSEVKKILEMSKEEAGIDPEFTSFWFPLNQALLSPSSTVGFVMSSFMVAYISGVTVSLDFLLILFLVTVQLSLASPGLTAGMTTLFQALGLSTEYIGIFSAYSIFIKNFAAGFGMIFKMLEQIEAAFELKKIDPEVLQKE